MKTFAAVMAVALLAGCSTVDGWMDAEWATKDYWFGTASAPAKAAAAPAATPGVKKLPPAVAAEPAPAVASPDVKGEHMMRIAGNNPSAAKKGAFEAARETCAKEEPAMGVAFGPDKAGEANGSFYHDVEFDCVEGNT